MQYIKICTVKCYLYYKRVKVYFISYNVYTRSWCEGRHNAVLTRPLSLMIIVIFILIELIFNRLGFHFIF